MPPYTSAFLLDLPAPSFACHSDSESADSVVACDGFLFIMDIIHIFIAVTLITNELYLNSC